MMRRNNKIIRLFVAVVLLVFLLSACLVFKDSNVGETHGLRIKVEDVYQGVKDGDVESVQLPGGNTYVTVEICVENLSDMEQTVQWQDVFIIAGDNSQIFPAALGYDQAEAFSWLLPIVEPIGGKRITHKFYFFLIQSNELMKIPFHQSLGCKTSSQFKSLALLFIVRNEIIDQPYTLNFLESDIVFKANETSSISNYFKWGIGLGVFLFLLVVTVFVVRKKKSKVQESLSQEEL
jgi:hypothetical protein